MGFRRGIKPASSDVTHRVMLGQALSPVSQFSWAAEPECTLYLSPLSHATGRHHLLRLTSALRINEVPGKGRFLKPRCLDATWIRSQRCCVGWKEHRIRVI